MHEKSSPSNSTSTVSYRTFSDENKEGSATFLFSTDSVEKMAKRLSQDHQNLKGLAAIVNWASQQNNLMAMLTNVPETLVDFDYIAEGLIEAGHGQVICYKCSKMYSVQELRSESNWCGSSLWLFCVCPEQHLLFSREIMHVMRRRSDC